MNWHELVPDSSSLLPGADQSLLSQIQEQIEVSLPSDFENFLHWRDGGNFASNRFGIYSAGKGVHPDETLLSANINRPDDFPLLLVGSDASEEFGFLKSDLPCRTCPVYFYLHETEVLDKVADSWHEFLVWCENQANDHRCK